MGSLLYQCVDVMGSSDIAAPDHHRACLAHERDAALCHERQVDVRRALPEGHFGLFARKSLALPTSLC